jgi:UDP-glucuronate 4-epimerase
VIASLSGLSADFPMARVLITGVAGFIGYHVAARCLDRGDVVVGIDNLNPYYDPALKQSRLALLVGHPNFRFEFGHIEDAGPVRHIFEEFSPDGVIHLAAQAGVRYSLEKPLLYGSANIVGTLNVLEACRHTKVKHLVLASSSSVYGANITTPFAANDRVDHPLSLYAATKRAGELMAHSYAHLFALPITALRFFTVYGPYGRPDMAIFSFTRAIIEGTPIRLFNRGDMSRDFTYIDDVCEGIIRALDSPACGDSTWSCAQPTPASSSAPFVVYNLGNDKPVQLRYLVSLLEHHIGRQAILVEAPMQAGDVHRTWADIGAMEAALKFRPQTCIEQGVERFVHWYRSYYGTGAIPARIMQHAARMPQPENHMLEVAR